jgi:hypothetical protein
LQPMANTAAKQNSQVNRFIMCGVILRWSCIPLNKQPARPIVAHPARGTAPAVLEDLAELDQIQPLAILPFTRGR